MPQKFKFLAGVPKYYKTKDFQNNTYKKCSPLVFYNFFFVFPFCVRSIRHAEQCFADFQTPFHPKSLITSLETSMLQRVCCCFGTQSTQPLGK